MAASTSTKRLSVGSKTDFKLCVLCQNAGGELVKKPFGTSITKLIDCVKERAGYGESGFLPINSRLQDADSEQLLEHVTWHRNCYQNAIHSGKIARAKQRYTKSLSLLDSTVLTKVHKGRPAKKETAGDITDPSKIKPEHFTRSSSIPWSKELCFFCNGDATVSDLHEVSSYRVGAKIRELVDNSDNNEWKVRLQPLDPNDARSIDIKYHGQCYITNVLRPKVQPKQFQAVTEEFEHITSADIEFFSMLQTVLSDGEVQSLDALTEAYVDILRMHGITDGDWSSRKLKKKITENMPDVEFSRPYRNKSELLCAEATKNTLVADASEAQTNRKANLQKVFDAASVVRNDILNNEDNIWEFDGSLHPEANGERVPSSLYNFLRWLLDGPKSDMTLSEERQHVLHRTAATIGNTIMYEIKSARQIKYTPKETSTGFRHSSTKHENQHVLGVGLKIHAYTRSKHLVDYLHANSVSVDYFRVLRVETQLAEAVIANMCSTQGVYIPPGLAKGKVMFFAMDNIDFAEDTPDGKNTLHATILVAFQQKEQPNEAVKRCLKMGSSTRRSLSCLPDTIVQIMSCEIKGCPRPKESTKYEFIPEQHRQTLDLCKKDNSAWMMIRSLQRQPHADQGAKDMPSTITQYCSDPPAANLVVVPKQTVPVWSGYNSIICKDERPITGVHVLPLIAAPANQWPTLMTVLQQAQHINAQVAGPDRKTIVTLDMDLYARALKLQTLTPDCFKHLILRVGEFHTVLCAVRAIGSSIEGSGIDDAWVEAGLYAPVTTRQILEGKHMNRALDAHAITVQALTDLLLNLYKESTLTELQTQATRVGTSCIQLDHTATRDAHHEMVMAMDSGPFLEMHDRLMADRGKHSMFKFMTDYMDTVNVLLSFIRASREGMWDLHLASLEQLCPLFFSQNRLAYAQHIPEYLAKMKQLQHTDPEIWQSFLEGNFCVKKGPIPFTSLGVDHALEQENRTLKVMGGLRGLTQKPAALTRFFVVAPELKRLSEEAESMAGLGEKSTRRHHRLNDSVTERHEKMIRELHTVLEETNPFKHDGDELVNIINKIVLPEHVKIDILRQYDVGKEAFNSFVTDRIIGTTSLWEPMKKVKLYKWTSLGKNTKTRVGTRELELKESRSLFARMAIAARSRPELDMADTVSQYEMTGVPRCLFAPDGSLLPSTDKSKLLHIVEELPHDNHSKEDELNIEEALEKKALIVDGMVIVHQLSAKQANIKTCRDLCQTYIEVLNKKMEGYKRVHVVFDQYSKGASLKHGARERRKRGYESREYVCVDSTPIRISLQSFLSHSRTKANLTEYLSIKMLDHFKDGQTEFVVSTANGSRSLHTNVEDLTSTHEEADTMIILHAAHANKGGYAVHIFSPDTDVFILALGHFQSIGKHSAVYLGTGDKTRLVELQPIYAVLGENVAAALPGFHSFTGCDTTGRFAGKGKQTCWKLFHQANPLVMDAFRQLGSTAQLPDEVFSALESFVCKMYKPKSKETDVGKLRWLLFKQSQGEAEKLPPTKDVLRYHILRAHYQAMIWHNACEAQPTIPPPDEYGWEKESDQFLPIISTQKPAPDEVMELVRCGCGVGKCKNNTCSCRKLDLLCTEMCLCEGFEDKCENTQVQNVCEESDVEFEDDDFDNDF